MSKVAEATPVESALEADLELARTIAWIVRDTPGIRDVSRGKHAEVATYGPGASVPGIAVEADSIEVHVVAEFPTTPLYRTAERLRSRIATHAPGRRIDVHFDDLVGEAR